MHALQAANIIHCQHLFGTDYTLTSVSAEQTLAGRRLQTNLLLKYKVVISCRSNIGIAYNLLSSCCGNQLILFKPQCFSVSNGIHTRSGTVIEIFPIQSDN